LAGSFGRLVWRKLAMSQGGWGGVSDDRNQIKRIGGSVQDFDAIKLLMFAAS
jgi:hypothetical protein